MLYSPKPRRGSLVVVIVLHELLGEGEDGVQGCIRRFDHPVRLA